MRLLLVRSFNSARTFSNDIKQRQKLYSKTVLLPQTTLPLRLDKEKLKERDALLNNVSQFTLI